MRGTALLRGVLVLSLGAFLGGCSALQQPTTEALIREPGQRHYGPAAPVSESAAELWQYAVISSNVYKGSFRQPSKKKEQITKKEARGKNMSPAVRKCLADPAQLLPPDHWTKWPDFPSEALRISGGEKGLYLEVWQNTGPSRTVAVVFKGTEFTSFADWVSNLRWFGRFIPNHEDQYTLLSKDLGHEFIAELKRQYPSLTGPDGEPVTIVAVGHSLGGGLAQHFAYSLPGAKPGEVEIPRVSKVYAFDSSPVTGWYSVKKDLRTHNAKDLSIDRIFEHGEILAYIRLLLSYVYPPSGANPAVREIRYNFVRTGNIISSHSMPRLACELAAAHQGLAPIEAVQAVEAAKVK